MKLFLLLLPLICGERARRNIDRRVMGLANHIVPRDIRRSIDRHLAGENHIVPWHIRATLEREAELNNSSGKEDNVMMKNLSMFLFVMAWVSLFLVVFTVCTMLIRAALA